MTTFFFSEPNAPIERLQRRVQMQKNSLAQAEADLRAAQAREGIEPEIIELEELEREHAPRTLSASVADLIIRADRKRRGLDQPEFLPGPRQSPPPNVSAEFIIKAMRKARGQDNE